MSGIKALEKLRELCVGVKSEGFASVGCDAVLEIADEIEREHAQRVAGLTGDLCLYEWRKTELKDALKAICKRFGVSSTKWSAEDAAKKVLETLERDYMELPVDADGVPICVGEDVVRTNDRLQPEVVRVIGVNGGSVFFKHEGRVKQNVAHYLHHVKPVTSESMVLDVVSAFMGISAGQLNPDSESVAKCAKMLEEWKEGE